MSDSPKPPKPQKEPEHEAMKPKEQQEEEQRRVCDYCNNTTALLYCRADSAKLCLSCDREVHSTNQLFSKHTRSLLCDVCDASPASIFCETEHSVLCQNCDWERHSLSLSFVHNRRPIEGFSGCPTVTEFVGNLGFEDLGSEKALLFNEEGDGLVGSGLDGSGLGDEYMDLLAWERPAVLSIDDLIVSSDAGQNFQALGMPPLPKNRNAVCGKHKEEILHQLRELARVQPDSKYENANSEPMFQLLGSGQNLQARDVHLEAQPFSFPGYEENVFHWLNDTGEAANEVLVPATAVLRSNFEESSVMNDKHSHIGGSVMRTNDGHEEQTQQLVPTTTSPVFPKVTPHELNSQERDSAISRYKEKRKTRRYDKHIRYESRKVRAESRTRIKGRFAKIDR